MEFHELPQSWQDKIHALRRENARNRLAKKSALAVAAALRAELAALKAGR